MHLQVGDHAFVYQTRPVALVTGIFVVGGVLPATPSAIAALEPDPCDREAVTRYVVGARNPTAILVQDPRRFARPLELAEVGAARAPQSYQYISADSLDVVFS